MQVFIDHCLTPAYANALDPYLQRQGGGAIALRNKFADVAVSDITWVTALQDEYANQGVEWCFFTSDRKIRRRPVEKQVFLGSGIPGFFLTSAFLKKGLNIQISRIFYFIEDIKIETENCYRQQQTRHFRIPPVGSKLVSLP